MQKMSVNAKLKMLFQLSIRRYISFLLDNVSLVGDMAHLPLVISLILIGFPFNRLYGTFKNSDQFVVTECSKCLTDQSKKSEPCRSLEEFLRCGLENFP